MITSLTFENLSIKINICNKPVLLCAIYRPPNLKKNNFLVEFNEYLRNFENTEIIIVGDFNINVDDSRNSFVKKYLYCITCIGYKNIVNDYRRIDIDNQSRTIIDHVLVKTRSFEVKNNIIECTISDHYAINILASIKDNTVERKSKNTYTTKINERLLSEKLNSVNWINVIRTNCVNTAMNNFCKTYNSILDSSKNASNLTLTKRRNPWMTTELISKCKKRDTLFKRWKNNKNCIS